MSQVVILVADGPASPTPAEPPIAGPAFLNARQAESVEALLLDPGRDPDPFACLRAIRSHASPAVYLKPVLVPDYASAPLRAATDGIWHPGEPVLPRVQAISEINRRAGVYLEQGPDQMLGLKLLRFIATRGGEFEPRPTTATEQGFVYPRLEPMQTEGGEGVLNTLEILEEQRLLSGRLMTRAHSCVHCGCLFLNFFEVCPHCQSLDVSSDDLVHHFRCGFAAELAEFEQADGLSCPKCHHALGNIGVDYDKPSVIYHCRNCTHDFQEPLVHSTCFACERSTAPENQVNREIQAYSMTALGQNAAALGFEGLFINVVGSRLRLWPWQAFNQMAEVEAARIERYAVSRSTVLAVELRGVEDLYARLGRRSREVFEEIAQLFTAILRRSDAVTARSETLFVALLTETGERDSERVIERLSAGMDDLVAQNLGVDLAMATATAPVSGELDVSEFIEAFLVRHGA